VNVWRSLWRRDSSLEWCYWSRPMSPSPNPRLQRTPSALKRKPLGPKENRACSH